MKKKTKKIQKRDPKADERTQRLVDMDSNINEFLDIAAEEFLRRPPARIKKLHWERIPAHLPSQDLCAKLVALMSVCVDKTLEKGDLGLALMYLMAAETQLLGLGHYLRDYFNLLVVAAALGGNTIKGTQTVLLDIIAQHVRKSTEGRKPHEWGLMAAKMYKETIDWGFLEDNPLPEDFCHIKLQEFCHVELHKDLAALPTYEEQIELLEKVTCKEFGSKLFRMLVCHSQLIACQPGALRYTPQAFEQDLLSRLVK